MIETVMATTIKTSKKEATMTKEKEGKKEKE